MNFVRILRSIFVRSNLDLSGNWLGFYGYGDNYSELVKTQKVHFIAQIEGKSHGAFKGTIKELENGIPEPAEISGDVSGQKITFTKTYEASYGIDDTGKIEKKSYGPQQVIYEGHYDSSTHRFYGQWRIEAIYTLESGRTVERISRGYWEMAKSND